MPDTPEIPLIVSHASCMDGHAAAWLAKRVWPDAIVRWCQYDRERADDIIPSVTDPEITRILIVDFSFPREQMEALAGACADIGLPITCLDHHRTAREHCAGLDWCVFDETKSGAGLMFDYLHQERHLLRGSMTYDRMADLVAYVQDRDLWQWKLPHSREINAALRSYPMTFEAWDEIVGWHAPMLTRLIEEGTAILRYQQQQVASLVKHGRQITLAGITGLAVPCNLAGLISEVAGALAEESGTFGATWFDDYRTQERVWSLRARDTDNATDVGRLAERFGGGGHPKAAGFRVPF